MDRPLGRHLVQSLGRLAEFFLGLGDILSGQGGREAPNLVLEDFLTGAIAGAPLDGLTDAFL